MWLILFGFREGAVELEGFPVINRRTPRMGHWIYSSTIRNFVTRYKLLSHLSPQGNSISWDGILRVPQNSNWFKISDFNLHCTLFRDTKLWYIRKVTFKINIKLLKPPGYVMHQLFNTQQLEALPTLYLFVSYLSQSGGAYRFLVGKPEVKRQVRRPRRRWMDNVRMDLQEVDLSMWSGLGKTRIETCGGLLWMRYWTFGFPKVR